MRARAASIAARVIGVTAGSIESSSLSTYRFSYLRKLTNIYFLHADSSLSWRAHPPPAASIERGLGLTVTYRR
jgi:hypothetical protein